LTTPLLCCEQPANIDRIACSSEISHHALWAHHGRGGDGNTETGVDEDSPKCKQKPSFHLLSQSAQKGRSTSPLAGVKEANDSSKFGEEDGTG
jgi:hypothetical protein